MLAVNPVNLLLVIFTSLTVNLTVNRAHTRAREEEKEEALAKARLWNVCPCCFNQNKARVIDRRTQCPFCNSPTESMIGFFGEVDAIEEAREEMRYRKSLAYEARDSRRRKPANAPATLPIRESEGYDKDLARGGVLA